jgi:signal transduction histidine kinase
VNSFAAPSTSTPADVELRLPVWIRGIVLTPFFTAALVIAQRWNEHHRLRSVVLTLSCVLAIVVAEKRGRIPVVRRIPFWVLAIPVPLAVVALIWTPVNSDVAPFFLVIISIQAALECETAESLVVVAASSIAMITVGAAGHFDGVMIWVLAIVLSWSGGLTMRYAIRLLVDLQAAQADLAERAAADERQRIARELHDVLAHSLSVATLHITGARMALKRSPESANEALEQAEQLARDSLNQVRAVIGMLVPDADGTAPSMPTADDIPRLVEEFRQAGAPVELHVDGELSYVTSATGLALYRVTQESLSNAVRHAPGRRAVVRISVRANDVDLDVSNDLGDAVSSDSSTGRGLIGMRERAHALAGTLDAGAERDHWRVRMSLPNADGDGP